MPTNTHISLKTFKMAFKNNLLHQKGYKKPIDNLTKEQRKGLKALQDKPEIIIQKADKGSAVVVMNTKDYLSKGCRQVLDTNFYTKIDHNPTKKVSDKISSKLKQMKERGLITDSLPKSQEL